MGLALQASEGIVQRQYFQGPNPGIFPRVIRDERRHEARLERDFATRKALVVASLEPEIGIAALARPSAAESVFEQLGNWAPTPEIVDASTVCQKV